MQLHSWCFRKSLQESENDCMMALFGCKMSWLKFGLQRKVAYRLECRIYSGVLHWELCRELCWELFWQVWKWSGGMVLSTFSQKRRKIGLARRSGGSLAKPPGQDRIIPFWTILKRCLFNLVFCPFPLLCARYAILSSLNDLTFPA